MGHAQDLRLIEGLAQNLQADGQAIFAESARDGDPWQPRQIAGMVKMSERYICKGSSIFSPMRKAGVGARRGDQDIKTLEGLIEILRIRVLTFCAFR